MISWLFFFWSGKQEFWWKYASSEVWTGWMWETCSDVSDFGHRTYKGDWGFPVLQFELSQTKASLLKKHLLSVLELTGRRWSCPSRQNNPLTTPGPTIRLQCPIGCQVTKLKEKLTTATSSNKKSGIKDYQWGKVRRDVSTPFCLSVTSPFYLDQTCRISSHSLCIWTAESGEAVFKMKDRERLQEHIGDNDHVMDDVWLALQNTHS